MSPVIALILRDDKVWKTSKIYIVVLYYILLSLLKLLKIVWNCILSPMTFSINLLSMFNNMMGWKDLGKLYDNLFSFRMIIKVKVLEWEGQYSRLI